MDQIKTGDVCEDYCKGKEFINYSAKSKWYDGWTKLFVDNMKDETGVVAIEEFFWLKPKMFLVYDSSGQNAVVRISKYKDALLNNKCLRHLMNKIQSSNQKMGTYHISKISLSCIYDKIYILNNGHDRLALDYYS